MADNDLKKQLAGLFSDFDLEPEVADHQTPFGDVPVTLSGRKQGVPQLAENVPHKAEQQIKQELLVRAIMERIYQGTDTQTILRATIQELSQLLGASKAIIRLGTQSQLLMQHVWADQKDWNVPEGGK
jgi:hypothetical protein